MEFIYNLNKIQKTGHKPHIALISHIHFLRATDID